MVDRGIETFIEEIKQIIDDSRSKAMRSIDFCRVQMYWAIGRRISEKEQQRQLRERNTALRRAKSLLLGPRVHRTRCKHPLTRQSRGKGPRASVGEGERSETFLCASCRAAESAYRHCTTPTDSSGMDVPPVSL